MRSIEEFKTLLEHEWNPQKLRPGHPYVRCMSESDFFKNLEKLATTTKPTVFISHCMDQVGGFRYWHKIPLLNQVAQQNTHLKFVIISVNEFELCNEVVRHHFPEYHAVYWPLYQSVTPSEQEITRLFLSLNKRGDPWRQVLYKKFWRDNLLEKSYFSYLCEDRNYGSLYHVPTWEDNRHWADTDFIPRFMPELTGSWPEKFRTLDDDILLDQYNLRNFNFDQDPTWKVDQHLMDTSLCSIIIETDIGNPGVNISEKTIRALAMGHPMLLLGAHGTHQFLRDLGFDLLDDVFDNSFDEEPETYARFCKFLNSIDLVDPRDLIEARPRCMANRQRVKELNAEMHLRAGRIVQSVFQRLRMWS